MSATLIATMIAAAAKAMAAKGDVSCAATAHGRGVDGVATVRNWPGGWAAATHAKHVFDAMTQGLIGPWRWVAVQVDPRLTVWVMHDGLSIGTDPPARIPINESNLQRIADRLGAQLGRTLLLPTPKISDAVHLAAAKGAGRVLDVQSIWNDPTEPAGPGGKVINQGQNVAQWLRQQERIKRAIVAAGGYPSSGVVSTVGKDLVLCPRIADIAKPGDQSGEAPGPKAIIYGWHTRQAPRAGGGGPWAPSSSTALTVAGWPGIQQQESGVHTDADTGTAGNGGFWDYSSVGRFVLDDCLLDGVAAKLSAIYATQPGIVYVFGGAAPRPIPTRYPMVPAPVAGA